MASVDKQYLYSVGRVKELEKGLLSEANLDRVLEAEDPLAVLRSVGFFTTTEDHEQPESLETLFLRERQQNRHQLHELIADSPLEDIFLLPHDIENIKLLLKGKVTGNPAVKDLALEEGKFSKDELVAAIYDDMPTRLPPAIREEIASITTSFQDTQRLADVDVQLERRLRLVQLELARTAGNRFLIEYLQRLSDLQNISTTLRRKWHNLDRETLMSRLLDTGTIAPSFFDRLYDGGWESVAAALKPTPYGAVVAQAILEVNQNTFLSTLDVLCARYLIEFLETTKQITFGIEPIIAFYLAWDNALKMIRTILVGKRFGYTQDQLHRHMRKLYA
ncbi:hypothetical protein GF339_18725 [candidate division KSB3 bacterium]|uniref:V-type ATP synthase subunit C n=1 Tax=candidate division KSB3 bacterium TaxID=2044937 RepID=A0A9D5Q791_9BACT|nr:hypothetical protein [candidate division KSB3 bacterium]MBD3326625.1 hypothetical protein [candidate division KSB3 bacterium]